jgi:hypothetical protein
MPSCLAHLHTQDAVFWALYSMDVELLRSLLAANHLAPFIGEHIHPLTASLRGCHDSPA